MNIIKSIRSPADIQSHLYTSFLQGSTADVALRVHGSWDAIYNLHRVVLIQSGFFRSLFTAGFIESSIRLGHLKGPDEILIRFDDPNITRAAFEVCIARLYGGGPPLDISPSLIASSSQPLTPSFPHKKTIHETQAAHHPATPRFLLSLLATSVYLSIPFLASQALSCILSTIGPYTVLTYHKFSLGKHIGHMELEPGEPEAAVGLELVGQIIEEDKSMEDVTTEKKEDGTTGDDVTEPSVHYGAISNKIGEACACWLAKWGTDLLPYEEKAATTISQKLSKIISSTGDNGLLSETDSFPCIWSRDGLDAKWVNALISADSFFIKGERERYSFACRVVELRRKAGVIQAEEQEWVNLFDHGIHYANMTMEDIIQISQELSPTTKQPFVKLSTLQAATWSQSILRHYVTSRPPSDSSTIRGKDLGIAHTTAEILATASFSNEHTTPTIYFPVPPDSSIRLGDHSNNDSTNTSSDGGPLSMDHLFTSASNVSTPPPSSPTLRPVQSTAGFLTSEADFFGLLSPTQTLSSIGNSDHSSSRRWSTFPPYRFAVEFWDLDSLKEKSRLHSHTIYYAGSLFNVYVQVVRKKGQAQLGVYLHRQSSIEPIPPSSAPASVMVRPRDEDNIKDSSSPALRPSRPPLPFSPLSQTTSHYSPSIYPSVLRTGERSISPPLLYIQGINSNPSYSPPTTQNILPATSPPIMPQQPFRDPRPSIMAYFAVCCASLIGSSQMRFTSSPDVFNISQSWGWKSSSLTSLDEGVGPNSTSNQLTSLRATVIIGLV